MPDYVHWFRYQLKASADGLEWAFRQLPLEFLDQLPPDPGYLGTWQPIRHVWHITEYERCLALPSMILWVDNVLSEDLDWPDDDNAWAAVQERGLETLIMNFRRVRQQQIDLLDSLTAVDWNEPRETPWGMKPLSMVVTKTFQHTYEHADTLLRMGIWWEHILGEIAKYNAQNET